MKVAIFGSRTLNDDRVKIALLDEIDRLSPKEIITAQEPCGVCEIGQRIAKELAIPLKVHFLNFKYRQGAFDHRSRDIVDEADYIILIHDGVSRGTESELKLVKKKKKPFSYIKLEIEKNNKNIGYNISQEWERQSENIW